MRDQSALDQSGSTQLGAAFGVPPTVLGFIRVGNTRNDSEVGGQLSFVGEVVGRPKTKKLVAPTIVVGAPLF